MLIDAGFTLVAYDGGRIAAIAAEQGLSVDPAAIDATERAIRAELAHHEWPQQPGSGAPPAGGARFFRRVLDLAQAAAAPARLDAVAELIWQRHLVENLWSRLLPGVVPALEALRAAGLKLAVVSNSEGTLAALLDQIDFTRHFHTVVDSWVLGVTKPAPAIFQAALDRVGVSAADAIMVGDSLKADVDRRPGGGHPGGADRSRGSLPGRPRGAVPRLRRPSPGPCCEVVERERTAPVAGS